MNQTAGGSTHSTIGMFHYCDVHTVKLVVSFSWLFDELILWHSVMLWETQMLAKLLSHNNWKQHRSQYDDELVF